LLIVGDWLADCDVEETIMARLSLIASLLFLMSGLATAQTRDPRVDELTKEVTQLKSRIADQDARIAELEKAVKFLQSTAAPMPAPIPSVTPDWHRPSNWTQVKKGMSEAQVVEILGPPTSVDSSIDKRILLYTPDASSTSTLKGSVTLIDDRVAAMTPPVF
jgi:outer membrane protein assembly factor BamE (lipoprotein component of BamABCDE complex)